jgi:uncharacterized protein YaaQ
MCLLIAIVQDEDARTAVDDLTKARFGVTRLATSGGFLHKGNATLLIGLDRPRVPEALRVLTTACRSRTETFTSLPVDMLPGAPLTQPFAVQVGGATVFVLDVQRFERV